MYVVCHKTIPKEEKVSNKIVDFVVKSFGIVDSLSKKKIEIHNIIKELGN